MNVKIQQRRIGYLFQDYQLFPNMTVYKNITFMAEPSEHIDQLIQTLNIDHLMKQYPRHCQVESTTCSTCTCT